MTPQEKAKELVDRFSFRIKTTECISNNSKNAKECALIAVEELIKETSSKYWYDVKHELEKL